MICRSQVLQHGSGHIISARQIAIICVVFTLQFTIQLRGLVAGYIRIDDSVRLLAVFRNQLRRFIKVIWIPFRVLKAGNIHKEVILFEVAIIVSDISQIVFPAIQRVRIHCAIILCFRFTFVSIPVAFRNTTTIVHHGP